MTTYYVDDGGSSTSPYDTWAKAASSLYVLDAAVALSSGDIVYIGHDSVQTDRSSITTYAFPTSGLPCKVISATSGSAPPAYVKSTTNQVAVSGTLVSQTMAGSFAFYGVRFSSEQVCTFDSDFNEKCLLVDCTVAVGSNNDYVSLGNADNFHAINLTIDLSADTSVTNTVAIQYPARTTEITGIAFVSPGYRQAYVFSTSAQRARLEVSGGDFSGFASGIAMVEVDADASVSIFRNCKTPSTWAVASGTPTPSGSVRAYNCGPSNAPTYYAEVTYLGTITSTASIYRTNGQTVESTNFAYLVTTTAYCSEDSPYFGPWMIGKVDSTGSKTFTVHITNDSADFTDAEVWLEVEYLGTTGSPVAAISNDQRATITTSAAAQADDTSSTWNGTGPSFTYQQTLSVTATVNIAGQYRARVVVGKPSIASSAYFYVDPLVTVS